MCNETTQFDQIAEKFHVSEKAAVETIEKTAIHYPITEGTVISILLNKDVPRGDFAELQSRARIIGELASHGYAPAAIITAIRVTSPLHGATRVVMPPSEASPPIEDNTLETSRLNKLFSQLAEKLLSDSFTFEATRSMEEREGAMFMHYLPVSDSEVYSVICNTCLKRFSIAKSDFSQESIVAFVSDAKNHADSHFTRPQFTTRRQEKQAPQESSWCVLPAGWEMNSLGVTLREVSLDTLTEEHSGRQFILDTGADYGWEIVVYNHDRKALITTDSPSDYLTESLEDYHYRLLELPLPSKRER